MAFFLTLDQWSVFNAGGRYHLYIAYACPWANRCLAVLYMKVQFLDIQCSTLHAPVQSIYRFGRVTTCTVYDIVAPVPLCHDEIAIPEPILSMAGPQVGGVLACGGSFTGQQIDILLFYNLPLTMVHVNISGVGGCDNHVCCAPYMAGHPPRQGQPPWLDVCLARCDTRNSQST